MTQHRQKEKQDSSGELLSRSDNDTLRSFLVGRENRDLYRLGGVIPRTALQHVTRGGTVCPAISDRSEASDITRDNQNIWETSINPNWLHPPVVISPWSSGSKRGGSHKNLF